MNHGDGFVSAEEALPVAFSDDPHLALIHFPISLYKDNCKCEGLCVCDEEEK
jgi:hypothetical protein